MSYAKFVLTLGLIWMWFGIASATPVVRAQELDADSTPGAATESVAVQAWAVDLALGGAHTCALTSGRVRCWGDNTHGQLGDGTTQARFAPVDVVGLPSNVTAIATGPVYSCAVASSTIWCWGAVLRQGEEEIWLTPQVVSETDTFADSEIVALVVGTARSIPIYQVIGHNCVLERDGDVWCWGVNENGQLGNGTTAYSDELVLATNIDKGATALAIGGHHTCALVRGRVKCWGWNGYGQLGEGTDGHSRWSPTDVIGLDRTIIAIEAGGNTTCALTDERQAWCWGEGFGNVPVRWDGPNTYLAISVGGEICGLRANQDIYCGAVWFSPFLVIAHADLNGLAAELEVGTSHTCIVIVDGGVECWGANDSGQLGIGRSSSQPTPVLASGMYTDAVAVSTQGWNSCALTSRGTVECWGSTFCDYGNERCVDSWQPIEVDGLQEGAQSLSGMCARTNSGTNKCWNSQDWLAQPVDNGSEDFVEVASGFSHMCGLTESGGVKCWGSVNLGQCGNGTVDCEATPADVVGLTSGVRSLDVFWDASCAVTDAGEVKCWGYNLYGNQASPATVCQSYDIGKGGTYEEYCYPTPDLVEGLPDDILGVALGGVACAYSATGEVACWAPFDGVTRMDIGAQGIAVGNAHVCAVVENGGVKCWGANEFGQAGNGLIGGQFDAPVDVVGLQEGVTAISADSNHTCAVLESGGVQCWGWNNAGQLGINPGQTAMTVVEFGVTEVLSHHLPVLLR